MRSTLVLSGIAFLPAIAAPAHAQWTVVNLHPTAGTVPVVRSYAEGSGNGRQGGYVFAAGRDRATVWSGSPITGIQDAHPAAASYSRIYSTAPGPGGDCVGVARFSLDHAALWDGPSLAFVDLHPSGAFSSVAYGTDGIQQVGITYFGTPPAGQYQASLWSGDAASFVSLHPGTASSFAFAVHNGWQVGYTDPTGTGTAINAALWAGTAASWVNLHPGPGSAYSVAYAAYAGKQGGIFELAGAEHAALWNGNPFTLVDLNPAGAADSEVSGMGEGVQVGSAHFAGVRHAGFWAGTAETWFDLHAVLTGSWGDTVAENVWVDGDQMYVTGSGFNPANNRDEALLWIGPVPAPACDSVDFNGDTLFPDSQDITDFLTVFGGGTCPTGTCGDIDFNNDGLFPDTDDIAAFIRVFAGGPCV
ncbi:MAG: hypothetical protein U0637_13745 [Phycisphaerales bacterium]